MTRFKVAPAAVFISILVSLVASLLSTTVAAQHPAQPQVPSNIRVAPVLAPVFAEILIASPTFAAQVTRIGAAKYLRVFVNPVMSSSTMSRGTARTTLHRFTSGALLAFVEMPVPITINEYAELFGHEFEHIIEQIDRVDLPALAIARGGATRLADGAYETTRARKAGQAIADEADRSRTVGVAPPLPQGSGAPMTLPLTPAQNQMRPR